MIPGETVLPRLDDLHQRIEEAYQNIAVAVGFNCDDCDGAKCCTVDLNLHTHLEILYMKVGFNQLDPALKDEVLARAKAMIEAKRANPGGAKYRSLTCALNSGGICILYQYRPLICRLAGIPHRITRPDGKVLLSGGCSRYESRIKIEHPDTKLDRTQFYRDMANIEVELINLLGCRARSRTVAETLCSEDSSCSELID
jgi:hypothetical protein